MNRKEDSYYQETIHGKNVRIIFSWLNYTPADYRADFKEYKKYLEKYYEVHPKEINLLKTVPLAFPEDKIFLETLKQEIEFDLAQHPLELKDRELVSFDEYRRTIEKKVSQLIKEIFEYDATLMLPAPSFYIKIDVNAVKDRDWYFSHFFDKAKQFEHFNKEQMYYQFSGYWLLHNILIPTLHLPDDPTHITNAKVEIMQQLKQNQDAVEKNLIDDNKLKSELKGYLTAKDSRNVRYLYTAVHGVWSSVLSEFYATYNSKKFITIPPNSIQTFRHLLEMLAQQPQNKATSFYEQYIGYQNIGQFGEINMGKIVGVIAVAAASESAAKPYDIFINGEVIKTKNINERGRIINDAIYNNQEIMLGNFDQKIVNQVLATIRSEKNLLKFIKYIELSFKVLNINPKNQVLNIKIFSELVNNANRNK